MHPLDWLKELGVPEHILQLAGTNGNDASADAKLKGEQKILDDQGEEKGKVAGSATISVKHTETTGADGKTTEDTAKVGADGSASNKSAGVNASASESISVKRTEGKDSSGRTVYTVTISGLVEGSAGAKITEGMASMSVKESGSAGKEYSMTFVLDPKDPDYKRKYAAVKAADTPQKLRVLQSLAQSSSVATSKSTDQDVTAGVGPVEFGINQGGKVTQKVTTGPDGTTVEVTGESHGGASLGAGPAKLKGGREDTFTGKVDPAGKGSGEVERKDTETDLGKSVSSLEDSIKTKGIIATAKDLATGKKKVLEEDAEAQGRSLDDDSFSQLAELAKDKSAWEHQWNGSVDTFIAWQALRPKILAANGDRTKIEKLMADFQSQGTGRSETLEKATGGTGAAFEFPDQLAAKKPIFQELVIGNPLKHPRELAAAGNTDGALNELKASLNKLTLLQSDIQWHGQEFQNPKTMNQMMDKVSARLNEIRAEIGKVTPKPKPDAAAAASPDDAKAKALAEENEKRAARNQIIDDLLPKCLTAQQKERGLFAEVEKELDKKNHWYSGNPDSITLMQELNKLKDSYDGWDGWVKQLRDVFQERGESPDRANQYAPNRQHYQDLYNQAFKS
jgi:hypothetical protein